MAGDRRTKAMNQVAVAKPFSVTLAQLPPGYAELLADIKSRIQHPRSERPWLPAGS